jgi:hypothetical protein
MVMSQLYEIVSLPNYGFSVAAGKYSDLLPLHKFGAVPSMSHGQTGTVWDVDDTLYPWDAWATAGVVTVPDVHSSDDGISLTMEGLDANFMPQTETITVSSSADVSTTKSFIRLFRAYTSASNNHDVLMQRGGTTVAKISAENAQTLMAVYTIPANYTGYLLQGAASCQSGADATGNMFVRYFGQSSFRVGHSFEVAGLGGSYHYDFKLPIKIPPKSDIDIRATVRSNNARITAAFDLLLHDTWQADKR